MLLFHSYFTLVSPFLFSCPNPFVFTPFLMFFLLFPAILPSFSIFNLYLYFNVYTLLRLFAFFPISFPLPFKSFFLLSLILLRFNSLFYNVTSFSIPVLIFSLLSVSSLKIYSLTYIFLWYFFLNFLLYSLSFIF